MKIIGKAVKTETKVEKKDDGLKIALKDLYHMLDAIEFAEEHKDEKLKAAYEKEAIALLRSIKRAHNDKFLKVM